MIMQLMVLISAAIYALNQGEGLTECLNSP
jgi:hypothetical protein